MGCGGCGSRRAPGAVVTTQISAGMKKEGAVMVEYIGKIPTVTLRGPMTNKAYRFGRDNGHAKRWIFQVDMDGMLKRYPSLIRVAEETKKAEPALR